jgi:hypothetical protein
MLGSRFESNQGALDVLWKHWRVLLAVAILAAMPLDRTAAQAGLNVGTLSCNVAGGWGLVLGSSRPMICMFTAYGGRSERYAGTIWKLGLDLGYTEGGVLIWTVFAPAANMVPGALAGTYVGGTASATVGVGIGANGLIGGSFNSIALQPLSIETNHGFNVSAGLASMTLSPS